MLRIKNLENVYMCFLGFSYLYINFFVYVVFLDLVTMLGEHVFTWIILLYSYFFVNSSLGGNKGNTNTCIILMAK